MNQTVTAIPYQKGSESIEERIRAVLKPADPDFARFLLGECDEEPDTVLEHAHTIAQLLAHVASPDEGSPGGTAIDPEFAGRIGYLLIHHMELARAMIRHADARRDAESWQNWEAQE